MAQLETIPSRTSRPLRWNGRNFECLILTGFTVYYNVHCKFINYFWHVSQISNEYAQGIFGNISKRTKLINHRKHWHIDSTNGILHRLSFLLLKGENFTNNYMLLSDLSNKLWHEQTYVNVWCKAVSFSYNRKARLRISILQNLVKVLHLQKRQTCLCINAFDNRMNEAKRLLKANLFFTAITAEVVTTIFVRH